MSCYTYRTKGGIMSVMNIWMLNLWYYNLLWCWDWRMNLWWRIILVDDNLVLKTIHTCEKELTISFEMFLLLLGNFILGRVIFMPGLCLTKATWGSLLVGYLLEYHLYVLNLNDILRCWELIPRGISDLLMYMRWIIVDGETWILEISKPLRI